MEQVQDSRDTLAALYSQIHTHTLCPTDAGVRTPPPLPYSVVVTAEEADESAIFRRVP
jgi:hypothetical protein